MPNILNLFSKYMDQVPVVQSLILSELQKLNKPPREGGGTTMFTYIYNSANISQRARSRTSL